MNALSKVSIWPLVLTGFICIIPLIYLQTCWAFTLPLIIDKELNFWTAMKTSRKQVGKHWWHVFGLVILIGLLNVAGMLVCCVGVLFTMPIGFAALMFAYETIFTERHGRLAAPQPGTQHFSTCSPHPASARSSAADGSPALDNSSWPWPAFRCSSSGSSRKWSSITDRSRAMSKCAPSA